MFQNNDIFEGCDFDKCREPVEVNEGPNPNWQGIMIRDIDDFNPQGFSIVELNNVYASLCNDKHGEGLVQECPSMEELEYYNPGTEDVDDDYILEAITVEHFSRTEKRMAAVVRTFNKHLSDSEIKALAPVVGKPKKSGTFAYVIVQLPFSDGQSVNVVFHSPEGDKKKIGANDAIIAFRWLLNKRDITQVVAPEDGAEVSLETIAKRITQLVVKNSAKFEKQQKSAQAEREELEKTREEVKEAEERQRELMDNIATGAKDAEAMDAQLSSILSQVENQKTINAELEAKIAALRKAGQSGKNGGAGDAGESSESSQSAFSEKDFFREIISSESIEHAEALYKNITETQNGLTVRSFSVHASQGGYAGQLYDDWVSDKKSLESRIEKIKNGKMNPQNVPYIWDAKELKKNMTKKEALKRLEAQLGELETRKDRIIENTRKAYEEYIEYLENTLAASRGGIDSTDLYSDDFGPSYPEFTGKPQAAIEQLLKTKQGYVPGAFHKEGLGDIDLPWGNSKFGLQHIIERRDKDGLDGIAFAKRLPEIIANGKVQAHPKDPNRKLIVNDTDEAVVSLQWYEKKKTWLVTAYPLKKELLGSDSEVDLNQTNLDGKTPPSNPEAENKINPSPPFVQSLNDIISGQYDADLDKIDSLLDDAASQAEAADNFDQYEDLFNQAADHLTELYKKKAGAM